jgi:hypothetical protein
MTRSPNSPAAAFAKSTSPAVAVAAAGAPHTDFGCRAFEIDGSIRFETQGAKHYAR